MTTAIFAIGIAYLLGSIPTSIIAGRLVKGIDIREFGSGNAGATNAFRVLGPFVGLQVAIIDLAKGFVAAFWLPNLRLWAEPWPLPEWSIGILAVLCAAAVITGHVFPLFARFRGGKGVAAGAGAVFAIYWPAGAVCLSVFIITVLVSRYVSLGSILAAICLPVSSFLLQLSLGQTVGRGIDWAWIVFSTLAGLFVVFRHIPNIKRLRKGTERKIRTQDEAQSE